MTKHIALSAALLMFAANAAVAAPFGQQMQYQAAPAGPQQVEICIVEGANICPPEDLDIVFPCITTGMLAGQSCPDAHHTIQRTPAFRIVK